MAVIKVFNSSFTITFTLSGAAITYNRSKAIILISMSFSFKHSKMVPLWLFATLISYFVIRFKLNRDRYLELASFTEMNFDSTLLTYYLSCVVESNSIKH